MSDERAAGWDADGMCDDHYRFGCPECAMPATPAASSAELPAIVTGSDERAREVDEPCEGGQHCCCCGPGEPCCDCGEAMPDWEAKAQAFAEVALGNAARIGELEIELAQAQAALAASRPTDAGTGVREALIEAREVLAVYAKPSGYVDAHGEEYDASDAVHPGVLAAETIVKIDAALATQKPPVDEAEVARIVRWIDQAIERAKKHGNTEGIWLFASQWVTVRGILARNLTGDGAGGDK